MAILALFVLLAIGFSTGDPIPEKGPKILEYSGPFGGGGGSPFSDCTSGYQEAGQINFILMNSGDRIDNIQVTYGTITGPLHGGQGGSSNVIALHPGEYIVAINGRSGNKVEAITFTTNEGRRFGPYGGNLGTEFATQAPAGYGLRCFDGRSGNIIDAFTFGWGPMI